MPYATDPAGDITDHMNLITRYSSHQRVLGYSRRTIGRREWSLHHWMRHLETVESDLASAGVEELEHFLSRWPAPASRYSIRSDVRQFYAWAIKRGYLEHNPTDALPSVKVPSRAATPIPADEVRRLLSACTDPLDRIVVMLAAYAGLRISEIAALRGEDVDVEARQLTVRAGKGGGDSVVPLSLELAVELERWPRHGRLVEISGPSVGARIRRLLRRLDIAGRPHDLRHSFGTQAARKTNGNLVLVSRLMRHATVSTTMRYIRWHTTGHEAVDGLYRDAA